jgi:hypothetical protein
VAHSQRRGPHRHRGGGGWVTDRVVRLRRHRTAGEPPVERPQQTAAGGGVGVDQDDDVADRSLRVEAIKRPTQRRPLATHVGIDVLEDGRSVVVCDLGRRVATVVGHDVNIEQLARVVESDQVIDGVTDKQLLVVGGHEDGERRRRIAAAGR